MPASPTHRRERAIVAALRDAGPMPVRALCKACAKLGPDAPQIPPTVRRLLERGTLKIAPGQRPGTRFPLLIVALATEA